MLDENLPTFRPQPNPDSPLSTFVYFTHNGSEPVPEYVFKKPDPNDGRWQNKYGIALTDAHQPDVIYAEVVIVPELQQPSLSAAEIRAQQSNGTNGPPVPQSPDAGFTVRLYDPDQSIVVRPEKSTWTGKESWEFEVPQQTFRLPSASALDNSESDPAANDLTPKIVFRWRRDGKFSKDMTCYLTGTSRGGSKSKDPDITVAMSRNGREPGLTIYEPNMQRVEVEDRKGLEVALLLAAEVIREIYLFPSRDVYNMNGAAPASSNASGRIRKNSKPLPNKTNTNQLPSRPGGGGFAASTPNLLSMSGGLPMNGVGGHDSPPSHHKPQQQQLVTTIYSSTPQTRPPPPPSSSPPKTTPSNLDPRTQAAVDDETKRLQALVEKENRDLRKREEKERKRIEKMLRDEEAQERRRKDAEVDRETERLRREYGMDGQEFKPPRPVPARPAQPPAQPSSSAPTPAPAPAPAPNAGGMLHPNAYPTVHVTNPNVAWNGMQAPSRPVSAGPLQGLLGNWFHGPSSYNVNAIPGGAQGPMGSQAYPSRPAGSGSGPGGRRRGGSAGENQMRKKRSVFF